MDDVTTLGSCAVAAQIDDGTQWTSNDRQLRGGTFEKTQTCTTSLLSIYTNPMQEWLDGRRDTWPSYLSLLEQSPDASERNAASDLSMICILVVSTWEPSLADARGHLTLSAHLMLPVHSRCNV